jgi:hypothetical protein
MVPSYFFERSLTWMALMDGPIIGLIYGRMRSISQRDKTMVALFMVWACFGALGQSALVFIDGKMNSTSYCEMRRDHFLPVINDLTHAPVIFQKDSASTNKSKQSRTWLNDNVQWITDWPSKSPDLNPIENMWGILARAIYYTNRQFSTKEELKAALIEC